MIDQSMTLGPWSMVLDDGIVRMRRIEWVLGGGFFGFGALSVHEFRRRPVLIGSICRTGKVVVGVEKARRNEKA